VPRGDKPSPAAAVSCVLSRKGAATTTGGLASKAAFEYCHNDYVTLGTAEDDFADGITGGTNICGDHLFFGNAVIGELCGCCWCFRAS